MLSPTPLAAALRDAQTLRDAGDPAAARRVLEEILAAERRLGDADPLILAVSFELGSVAAELGNRHEARRNFNRVATAGPAVLGEDHWTVRAARRYLDDPRPGDAGRPQQLASSPAASFPPPVLTVPAAPPGAVEPAPPGVVEPAPAGVGRQPARGRAATVAAVVATGAATLALALVIADRPPRPADRDPAPGPTLAGTPPTGLRLRDDGTAVTVSWADPTSGTVPFIVAGGRTGQTLGALATINPGGSSYTVNGLNPRLDYCFTILAVYATNQYATSGQVCTTRSNPTAR